ncbi:MAG: hypothetical protein WAJ93_11615, partial [Candidatus Nitrosopolaris sp.]|jgi:hypothetical protein
MILASSVTPLFFSILPFFVGQTLIKLSCSVLMSTFDLLRNSVACSLRAPISPMKSKNNFNLRGYCLLDSEDFSAYMNESNGPLVFPGCCISNANLSGGW